MTPLRLDEKRFEELPDTEQHKIMFEAIEKLVSKVEDLCGARKSFRHLAIKWGGISGGCVAFLLILIHDPNSYLGKIAGALIKSFMGG